MKKIIFFGTPQFTTDFLETFKSAGFEIVGIVTGEDKPVGRGQQMHKPAPKVWGEENSISVLQPTKLDDAFFEEIQKYSADLFIVIAYGKIIPQRVIDLPKFGTINLHYSLLPKYRGASPVESAILNNEKVSGITIQQMVYELDAGNILFQEEMKIEDNDTTETLRENMNRRAQEIFPEFLNNLFSGNIFSLVQDSTLATKSGKFKKEDMDVTKYIKEKDLNKIYTMYKVFPRKIYFFHGENNLRVKITSMIDGNITKLLPESRKEISVQEFETSFGKIF
jgi:methionyl-tRNA formyltransferase